jgi:hypothetical protein
MFHDGSPLSEILTEVAVEAVARHRWLLAEEGVAVEPEAVVVDSAVVAADNCMVVPELAVVVVETAQLDGNL